MKFAERARQGIRRYSDADRGDLVAFQRRMFGDAAPQVDAERFSWLFERNPHRSPEGPGLWMCRRDGAVVGQQAEIPFDLMVDGEPYRAAWAIDLMVDPAWRIRGVGPVLTQTQLDANDIVAGVTVSDAAYRSYRRSGWSDIGFVHSYVRPVDVRRAVPRAESHRVRSGLIRPIVAAALKLDELLLRTSATVRRIELVPIESFDERVDALLSEASGAYRVLRRRDSHTLRWFFDDRADRSDFSRFYLQRAGRILGYLVVRIRTEESGPVAVVADYYAPPHFVPVMIARLIAELRHQVIAVRLRTLNVKAERRLVFAGFARADRDTPRPMRLLAKATIDDDRLRATLSDRQSWLFTSGDADLETGLDRSGSPLPGAGST